MKDRLNFRAFYQGNFIYKTVTDANYYTADGKCIALANTLPNTLIWKQCTGLKDKNGKLIYEGDIVEYLDDYWIIIYNKPRMEWGLMGYDYAIYGRDIKKYDLDVVSCEIIGNIHENPELLEQSSDD